MEYLVIGLEGNDEICPMSAPSSCSPQNCTCYQGAWIEPCTCKSQCYAQCSTLFICGAGQNGMGPLSSTSN